MNANQIINMVIRMVMQRAIRGGVNAGINAISNRKNQGNAIDGDKAGGEPDSAETQQRMRQAMRVTRRLGRF